MNGTMMKETRMNFGTTPGQPWEPQPPPHPDPNPPSPDGGPR